MKLPKNLVSQFVKNTTNDKNTKKETFVQGRVVVNENGDYLGVKLTDNSDNIIPASVPANVKIDQLVNVMIKNHTISVIGNIAEIDKVNSNQGVVNGTTLDSCAPIDHDDIENLWK